MEHCTALPLPIPNSKEVRTKATYSKRIKVFTVWTLELSPLEFRGVSIFPYLDDRLIYSHTREDTLRD